MLQPRDPITINTASYTIDLPDGQIMAKYIVTCICRDGSMWMLKEGEDWERLPDIPEDAFEKIMLQTQVTQ